MGKILNLCALLLGSLLVFGCAGNKSGLTAEGAKADQIRNSHSYEVAFNDKVAHDPATGHKIVSTAHKAIGTPYVLGGSKPGGFDCSGLVSWTYKSVGVQLPRTAREQSVVGKKIKKIEDMRAGDIVAFRHPKRGYHTGIYVGDGKFIHSPRKRSTVRINSLSDPYFSQTLLGARRINVKSGENLVAQAESILGKDSLATPRSVKRNAQASRNSKAVKNQTKASKKQVVKAVASNTKKATAHKKNTVKSKRETQKTAHKKGSLRTVAKGGNAKHGKLTAASAKHHTPAAKLVANKSAHGKKNSHKSVSMLQHKNTKGAAKSRNRS